MVTKYLVILLLGSLFAKSSIGLANQEKISDTTETNQLISMAFYQTDIAIILQALADSKQMNLIMTDDLSIQR